MELKEEFETTQVEQQNMFSDTKTSAKVIQWKNNCIPKGLIPLEKLFDHNDVATNPKIKFDEEEIETYNISTIENPKCVNLSKYLSSEVKQKYVYLMKRYIDVFAWSYVDLKIYDHSFFQHTIPIMKMKILSNKS